MFACFFCATVHARQLLNSGDQSQVLQQAKETWWDPQTPEMDAAYAHARRDTQPQLVNATDYKYFKELYGTDKDNALEKLSLTSPATQPSKKQVEAQAAREKAQMDKIMPKVRAEETEANKYYHDIFPYDANNPLEEFTYSSKNQGGGAKSNSSL